jgi:hypothetical protein
MAYIRFHEDQPFQPFQPPSLRSQIQQISAVRIFPSPILLSFTFASLAPLPAGPDPELCYAIHDNKQYQPSPFPFQHCHFFDFPSYSSKVNLATHLFGIGSEQFTDSAIEHAPSSSSR